MAFYGDGKHNEHSEGRFNLMKAKPVTAKELYDFLNEIADSGIDLSKVTLNYRYDEDSDVAIITSVEEDLFDAETNSILTSIIFQTI